MDAKIKNKYCLAVKMVEDGAIETFDDVSLNNETYPKNVLCLISDNDVMGVKWVAVHLIWIEEVISFKLCVFKN